MPKVMRKAPQEPFPAVPEGAKQRLRTYISARQQAEQQLQAYISGLKDTLGLTGPWNLDVDKMLFVPRDTPPALNGNTPTKVETTGEP